MSISARLLKYLAVLVGRVENFNNFDCCDYSDKSFMFVLCT